MSVQKQVEYFCAISSSNFLCLVSKAHFLLSGLLSID